GKGGRAFGLQARETFGAPSRSRTAPLGRRPSAARTHGGGPIAEYAHPEALADTSWLAEHAKDPKVRVFEVDVDTSAYEQGHVDNAIGLNWRKDLQQSPVRDLIDKTQFEALLSRSGATADTTIAVYGDNNNWFAAW